MKKVFCITLLCLLVVFGCAKDDDKKSDTKSNNAFLKSLQLLDEKGVEIPITPAFSKEKTTYSATVERTVTNVSVKAEKEDSKAADPVTTGTYKIDSDTNIFTVTVVAEDGTTSLKYTITAKKKQAADTTAPVITLNGTAQVSLFVGDTYADAGAKATDDIDGDISSTIVSTIFKDTTAVQKVDTSAKGVFTIKYNVADKAGNKAAEVVRTVTVNEKSNIPANTFRIHFHRWDKVYTNWTLWAWGDTPWTGSWAHGIKAAGTDDYGAYYDLPINQGAKRIGFFMVIETNGTKDSGDREFIDVEKYKEIWITQDCMTNFTEKVNPDEHKPVPPSYDLLVREKEYIEIDNTKVKLLFKADADTSVNVYMGESADKLTLYKNFIYNDTTKADNTTTIYLENLTPGKTYFYKVTASKGTATDDSGPIELKRAAGAIDTKQTAEWARKAVFYEIFTRSFYDSDNNKIGDLNGITAKLDYLKELGVTALYLMPVCDAYSYHGYDVMDYQKISPDYGSNEDMKKLLDAAHAKGIKIVLDFVANHTAYNHPWFRSARDDVKSPYRDYYCWEQKIDNIKATDSSWTSYNGVRYYSVFGATMPDLNLRKYEVREEMKKFAKFWIDMGVDGFRLDAAMHIDSFDKEVTHNWWQEFNTYCKNINKDLYIVGENWTETPTLAPFFADMDSSFNFPAIGSFVSAARQGLDVVSVLLKNKDLYSSFNPNYIDATFVVNHDMTSRAASKGISKEQCGLLGAIFLTTPGTPFIYYGEELGQRGSSTGTGQNDQNMREPLDWYASGKGTGMTSWQTKSLFVTANDGISVEEESAKADSVLSIYKKFGVIRRDNADVFAGDYKVLSTLPAGLYGYEVSKSDVAYKLTIVHNYGETDVTYTTDADVVDLANGDKAYAAKAAVTIKPQNSIVLKSTK